MGRAKNAGTLSAHVSNEIIVTIRNRAAPLNWTPSKFTALILEKWLNDGAPPVHPIDESMVRLSKLAEKEIRRKG